jgi:hypothetical protein
MHGKWASDSEEQLSLQHFFYYAGYMKPHLGSTFPFGRLLIC